MKKLQEENKKLQEEKKRMLDMLEVIEDDIVGKIQILMNGLFETNPELAKHVLDELNNKYGE